MADARLQSHWLNNPDFDELHDASWRVFTGALLWCNGRGTDGRIPTRYVRMLHPEGDQPAACNQLLQLGFWTKVDDGYQLVDWVGKLGQSTAEAVEHNKASNRAKQQKWRDDQSLKLTRALGNARPVFVTDDVMSDVTGDITGYVGQDSDSDRTGLDRAGLVSETAEVINLQTGEITPSAPAPSGWAHVDGKTRRVRQSA